MGPEPGAHEPTDLGELHGGGSVLLLGHDPARGAGQEPDPEPKHGQAGVGLTDAADLPRLGGDDEQFDLAEHVAQEHLLGDAVLPG